MKLEESNPVDQRQSPQHPLRALQYIEEHREQFVRQGCVVASHRKVGERINGPYFRLAFRGEGQQHSIYIGRDPQAAEAVRTALNQLHALRRRQLLFDKWERDARRTLRLAKIQADFHIRPLGLRFHGFEIRGWRRNPVFSAIPWGSRRKPQPVSLAIRFQRRLQRLQPMWKEVEASLGIELKRSPRCEIPEIREAIQRNRDIQKGIVPAEFARVFRRGGIPAMLARLSHKEPAEE